MCLYPSRVSGVEDKQVYSSSQAVTNLHIYRSVHTKRGKGVALHLSHLKASRDNFD